MSEYEKQKANRVIQKQGVVFFFGAGASVDAAIPDTYRFVTLFEDYVKNERPELYDSLSEILRIRKERGVVDVEQLLVTLEHLKNRDNEILLDFYEKQAFNKNIKDEKVSELEDLLQNFIRKTVVVEEECKLEYLRELIKFIPPALEIYSVNYDTCIEQLSYMSNLRYTDGFDIYWNPENFDKDVDVKLFKMHGSIVWFESQTKEYLKIPVRAFANGKEISLRLITGEELTPLIIYPMQKWQYIEPLTELQLMFKKRLVDEDTMILVVVGYSFRDDYILNMLWDAARINSDLHIILVNPDAQKIFQSRMRFLKDGKTPSRIANRVVCLPYPFARIIHLLKNDYIKSLTNCINNEKLFIQEEKMGGRRELDWERLFQLCVDCEFSTKANLIFEERMGTAWLELDDWTKKGRILSCMKALLHSLIAEDEFATKWLERTNKMLEFTNCRNLEVEMPTQSTFFFSFKVGNGHVDFVEIRQLIESLKDEIDRKSRLLSDRSRREFNWLISNGQKLKDFIGYLNQLQDPVVTNNYLELRTDAARVIEPEVMKYLRNLTIENKKSMDAVVLHTEEIELKKIFNGQSLAFRLDDS